MHIVHKFTSGSGTLQAALANAVLLLWNALPAFTGIRQTVGATGFCVYLYWLYFCGGSLEQTSIIVNYLQPWAETPSGRLQGGGEQQYVSYILEFTWSWVHEEFKQEQRWEWQRPALPSLPLSHRRRCRPPPCDQPLLQVPTFHVIPCSVSILDIAQIVLLSFFHLSVRRRPEPAPAQYLVEGSCTLPRIDGLQGYTLPR